MAERTPVTVNGVDLELTIDDVGLLHIFKQDTEIGAITTTEDIAPPPPEPPGPRFAESEFETPFVPDEPTDPEEPTDA